MARAVANRIGAGPLVWLRFDVPRGTPRWWQALGCAVLRWLAMFALIGLSYALVMALLSGG
jgi:hypothetical protein